MRPLGSETFTILRAPLLTDFDGSQYRDWTNPVEIVVNEAMVEPFPMAEKLNFEDNREREYARTAIRIFAPPGTRFESTDHILYDGDTYDVFGHQGVWRRFNGEERYVQVIARIREG